MGRESILRLKVVGTETVKNDLSQIEAAGFRTARNLQRAYDVARQTTPRTPEGIAARETVRDIEKQLVGYHSLWKMTDQAITAQRRLQLEAGKAETAGGGQGGMFSGMGQKRILRQMIGFEASRALGNIPGIGQEAGLIAGGFLYGSPMLGAVMAAAVVVGETLKGMTDANNSAKQAMTEFSDRLSSLSKEIASMSAGSATTTPFGAKAAGLAAQAGENQVSVAQRYANLAEMSVSKVLGNAFERTILGRSMGQTGIGREMEVIKQETAINDMVYVAGQEAADKQSNLAERNDSRNTELQRRLVKEQANPEGRNRRWGILGAQANIETEAMAQGHQMQTEEAKFAAEQSSNILHKLDTQLEEVRKKGQKELIPGLEAKIVVAARASIEADKVVKSLPEKQRNEAARLAFAQEQRRHELDTKDREEDKKQDQENALNKIQLYKRGYEQQRASLVQQYDFEIDKGKKAGDDVTKIEADKTLKLAILDKQHGENVKDTLDDIRDKQSLVTRQTTEEQVQWNQTERSLVRSWGEGRRAEIQDVAAATQKYFSDKHQMELADIAAGQRIRLGMIHGTIDPYEAKREELRRQNKYTPAEIESIVRGEARGDSATFVKQERMKKDPYKVYDEYNKSLLQALGNKEITKAEYDRRKMDKAQELLGRTDGQFMDAMSYVRNTQTALLADANIPKETRDGILAIMGSVAIMVRDGIPLRG